jgi:D-alanyl-D-alanine endopeptidase (penicillin-binding protein 7)
MQERKLHHLEKIVAVFALLAVLALTVGFAQAGELEHQKKVFLRSSVALVQDADSGETILAKNSDQVAPIASITKLMTAMVILDRGLDLNDEIVVSREDIDHLKGTHSRLLVGARLTRKELLLLALMASENRAAAALGRTYPGGTEEFVAAMNRKARALGMHETHYVDPTGLDSGNVSSAEDLAKLVKVADGYPLIREFTTTERAVVRTRGRKLEFVNTNRLVRNPRWDIYLSKTGYISEAGRCLVMRVRVASKDLIVVLLDSWGKYSRFGDANRIRKWLESSAYLASRG